MNDLSDETALISTRGIQEVTDFSQLTEDCFEISFIDFGGLEHTVQLTDLELEDLAEEEEEVRDWWDNYVEAGHEVAAESYAERRQMGMCDF